MQRGREERKEEEERSVIVNYARTKNVVSNEGHSLLISKSGAPLFASLSVLSHWLRFYRDRTSQDWGWSAFFTEIIWTPWP